MIQGKQAFYCFRIFNVAVLVATLLLSLVMSSQAAQTLDADTLAFKSSPPFTLHCEGATMTAFVGQKPNISESFSISFSTNDFTVLIFNYRSNKSSRGDAYIVIDSRAITSRSIGLESKEAGYFIYLNRQTGEYKRLESTGVEGKCEKASKYVPIQKF